MSKEDEPVTSQQALDDGQVHVRFIFPPQLALLVFMIMSAVMLFISVQWDSDVKLHKSIIEVERRTHKEVEEALKVESTKRDECQGRLDRLLAPQHHEPDDISERLGKVPAMVDCIIKQTAWIARVAAEIGMPEEDLRKSLKGDLSVLDSLTRRQKQKLLAKFSDFPSCMGNSQ